MKLAVVGTGYVGVVTRGTLSEIGHHVTCIDIDETKIEKIRKGISPIYEPGLSELMKKNIEAGRLAFTSNHEEGFNEADIIYIADGTPENEDGWANLPFVKEVATTIALTAKKDTIVVTKSTVPVGTNDRLRQIIDHNKLYHINIKLVSDPEFLKEESAVYDSFHGDRIVIGASNEEVALVLTEWDEIKNVDLTIFKSMKTPLIFDGRNSFDVHEMEELHYEYFSIGRRALKPHLQVSLESW